MSPQWPRVRTPGAATPVSGTGQEIEETLAKKIQSDAAAYARSIAERRGRPPEIAEKAVTEAKSWTAQEALEAGLIDHIAGSEAELLSKLDGVAIRRIDGAEVVVATAGASVVLEEMSLKDRILSVVANPNIAILLGLIGLAGLYLEFSNPGTLVPGIVGGHLSSSRRLRVRDSSRDRRRDASAAGGLRTPGGGSLHAVLRRARRGWRGRDSDSPRSCSSRNSRFRRPALEVSLSVILPVTLFLAAAHHRPGTQSPRSAAPRPGDRAGGTPRDDRHREDRNRRQGKDLHPRRVLGRARERAHRRGGESQSRRHRRPRRSTSSQWQTGS